MSDGAPAASWSQRARTLSQLGVIVVVVWLIFIGTFYLKGGVYSELAGVEFNVSMFGMLFALTFLFLNRSRASLVCTVITLLALAWFSITGGTALPGWFGLDWLFHCALTRRCRADLRRFHIDLKLRDKCESAKHP